jgi:aspartyl-tRNA(Asn)/glutamyl-tRNA(Gln) amidotransferase subunit A
LELWQLSARDVRDVIARKEASAADAARSALDRIGAVDGRVHAFLQITDDIAMRAAEASDARIAAGEAPRPLEGVPIAIKDNMCMIGAKATCASQILKDWKPPYDATVVQRVLAAGAVPVGKTNLDEFAMGSSTENSSFGPTHNPWDLSRAPGGSSGGSAAAVAAGMVPIALGSDTGGSIRQPASFCGVTGVKPTYGRVSRYGLVAFASSLDQIGPFARDVLDAALLMQEICGHDPRDSTSAAKPVGDFVAAATDPTIEGLRLGVPREYFGSGIDEDVARAVRDAIEALERLGAAVEEVSLPHTEYAVAAYYVIATAEASSNLARYDGVHYGHRTENAENIIGLYSRSRAEAFGDEVKRRIMLGTYALSAGYYDAYYLRALKVRSAVRRDFDQVFARGIDAIVCPTSPTTAFKLGEKTADPLSMYLSDTFTISVNLAALPGMSVPCGTGDDGMPVGLQFVCPPFEESRLLAMARAYERESGSSAMRPPIWEDGGA